MMWSSLSRSSLWKQRIPLQAGIHNALLLQLVRPCSHLTEQISKTFSLEGISPDRGPGLTQQIQRILKSRPKDIGPLSDVSVTPEVLTDHILLYYKTIHGDDLKKKLFYTFLVKYLGPDRNDVYNIAKTLTDIYSQDFDSSKSLRAEIQLQNALRPLYVELFHWLAHKDGGLKALIDMRSDLLSIIQASTVDTSLIDGLKELDVHFRLLLSQWFSHGFLDLQQITWQSPCDIVEKVSHYEAVHSVRHWKDMKHRVGPYRRVFVFTHCSIPRDPIIILHCALTRLPSSNIQTLLNRQADNINNLDNATTAVFYSISAAHKGLSGIELGNSLILQVAQALKREISTLQQFVTLSPIPGFRKWLETHLRLCSVNPDEWKSPFDKLKALYPGQSNLYSFFQHKLDNNDWSATMSSTTAALKEPLLVLCAKYLLEEKRRGFALNPVTNFHVRNGASLWRLNWLADTSPKGLKESFGIMANYQYDLSCMNEYNQDYMLQGIIHYSDDVANLLKN